MHSLEPWKGLLQQGAFEVLFDWCRFGEGYRKTTRLLTNILPLVNLGLRCHHKHRHVPCRSRPLPVGRIGGREFCRRVVQLVGSVWSEVGGVRDFVSTCSQAQAPETRGPKGSKHCCNQAQASRLLTSHRKQSSSLWALQLSESLPWHTIMQYRFKVQSHINLQEAKARRSLVKRLPRDKRVVIAQDSRVNLGALGKGRSPSQALNSIMRSEAPYVLGKNLYVAGVPTWSIRADAPSRASRVQPPRIPCPQWFWELRAGRHVGSELDALEGLPRAYNRWSLFIGALLLRASLHEEDQPSDSRQVVPGEGTHYRTHSQNPTGLAAASGDLVAHQRSWRGVGIFGETPHRHFVRVARGVYDRLVRQQTEPKGCSGNPECSGPEIWMAEVLACQCVGSPAYMGGPGAGGASSTDARAGSSCACNYCACLAMAESCGPFGPWLFWFTETVPKP